MDALSAAQAAAERALASLDEPIALLDDVPSYGTDPIPVGTREERSRIAALQQDQSSTQNRANEVLARLGQLGAVTGDPAFEAAAQAIAEARATDAELARVQHNVSSPSLQSPATQPQVQSDQLTFMTARCQTLEAKLQDLVTRLATAEETAETAEMERHEIETQLLKEQKARRTATDKVTKLQSEIERLKQTVSELTQQAVDLRREADSQAQRGRVSEQDKEAERRKAAAQATEVSRLRQALQTAQEQQQEALRALAEERRLREDESQNFDRQRREFSAIFKKQIRLTDILKRKNAELAALVKLDALATDFTGALTGAVQRSSRPEAPHAQSGRTRPTRAPSASSARQKQQQSN